MRRRHSLIVIAIILAIGAGVWMESGSAIDVRGMSKVAPGFK